MTSNNDDKENDQKCSKETVWTKIDTTGKDDTEDDDMTYNGNNIKTNDSIMMNFCDNTKTNETKNDSQWNKACMCTGPDVNGSWVPCNSSSKLQAFSIYSILIIIWTLRSLSSRNKLSYFRLQYM